MDWLFLKPLSEEGVIMLTNSELVYFAQHMIGAPYWPGASCIKATPIAFETYKARFPEFYTKDYAHYEKHILQREIVTDNLGLIKGFAWNDGGKNLLESRGTDQTFFGMPGTNGCPDKTIKGMMTWAMRQGAKWGTIDTLPDLPGVILAAPERIAIYENNNHIIEANAEAGKVVYIECQPQEWKYWFCLPFIDYIENPKEVKIEEQAEYQPSIFGIAIALDNVISKAQPNEASQFLNIIPKGSQVKFFDDSTNKWLHILENEVEKYTFPEYFLQYPGIPDVLSPEAPTTFRMDLRGKYRLIANTGIRDKAHTRGHNYTVMPIGQEVYFTGGIIGDWVQIFADIKNKKYVGYVKTSALEGLKFE